MDISTFVGLGGIPLVVALTGVIKESLLAPRGVKYLAPLVALCTGVAWITAVELLPAYVAMGIIVGAGASGYFDVLGKIKK